MKKTVLRTVWILAGVAILSFAAPHAERIVYPQAAVGPAGDGAFEIQLRLGNTNQDDPWSGTVRLLRQTDLSAMTGLTFRDENGQALQASSATLPVQIPAAQSRMVRISASTLQIGVLVIEPSSGSPIDELATSFYYFLLGASGRVADVIAVQGQKEAHGSYRVMISSVPTFDVGVAVVAAKSLPTGGTPSPDAGPTEVDLTAFLKDGSSFSGSVSLGGTEDFQKALFPMPSSPSCRGTSRSPS